MDDPIEISGAGPAGLAAAIVAAKAGRRVIVYEQRGEVGARFSGDFQGLENWTTEGDVLEGLAGFGIEPTFDALPVREQISYDPKGERRVLRSAHPFYYLVRRGPYPGSLDEGLKQQALAAGVELRLKQRREDSRPRAVVASGPKRSLIVAAGYTFPTDLPDGCYVALSDRLAPGGYAYLLIWGGKATLATCIFRDFPKVSDYLGRAVRFFEEKTGIVIEDPRRCGGVGDAYLPRPLGRVPNLAGEAAGIQDALWGFGIRYALMSGCIAGRVALGEPRDALADLWTQRICRPVEASFVNRWLYSSCGDVTYRLLLRLLARSRDPRGFMRDFYRPRWWKLLFSPLAAGLSAQRLALERGAD